MQREGNTSTIWHCFITNTFSKSYHFFYLLPVYSEHLFQTYSTNTAVINEEGTPFFYHDLFSLAEEIYSHLGHRCLVFSFCSNSIESLAGYIAFLSHKVVPLLLDATMDSELVKKLISVYQPEYLWIPTSHICDFDTWERLLSQGNYTLIRLQVEVPFPLHDNLALLLTTSGSTGSPKLVRLSYENLSANAESIAEYLDINGEERPITTLPMHYSFGLSVINSHLLKGASLLLTNRSLMEKEFWSFLKSGEATSLSGVPYTFEMLKKLRFFRLDLPHLKTLTQAGGKMNIDLNREFAEFCHSHDKQLFVMYGQTEATARMSYLPPQYALSKLGSMGIAIPGGEFSLIDEKGKTILASEEVGELVYKGRNVSLGYAESGHDLIKGDENKGTLITGDLAKRDADGFYYIVGRKKRFIKIFGNRVNLDETERLLKNIISECACTGTDDHMLIYINDLSRRDEVIHYISTKTGIHPQAFSVKYIDRIPKNSSGKTIYSRLIA